MQNLLKYVDAEVAAIARIVDQVLARHETLPPKKPPKRVGAEPKAEAVGAGV